MNADSELIDIVAKSGLTEAGLESMIVTMIVAIRQGRLDDLQKLFGDNKNTKASLNRFSSLEKLAMFAMGVK